MTATARRRPKPDDYNAEQMAALLLAGAQGASNTMSAAVHLLAYTELPGRRDFARTVRLGPDDDEDDSVPVSTAWVHDWDALLQLPVTGGDRRMLALAVSLATGRGVDLKENIPGQGTAHAKRIIEAFINATGMHGFYRLEDGPELTRMRDFQRDLLGAPACRPPA